MAGSREDAWNVEKSFREGQAKQRLDDLFFYFIDVARKLRPKVVVAENVKGLITGNAKGWVNRIVKAFDDAGYVVQIFLFNASRMGVPQKRERVFFIAHKKDLDYPKLKMDFGSKPIPFSKVREPYGKALGDNLAARLMKYRIPSDRCLQDINRRVRKTGSGFTSPINHDDEPVQTITAGGYCFRMVAGDSAEMQKAIEMLDSVKESIINAYEIKTGLSRNKLSRLMDEETWMDARKAMELGFIDGILEPSDLSSAPIREEPVMDTYTQAAFFTRRKVSEDR